VSGLRRALGLVAIQGIVVGLVALAIVLSSDHVEGKRRRDRCRLDQLGGRPQLGRTTGSPFMNPAQPARHGDPGASPVDDLCDRVW